MYLLADFADPVDSDCLVYTFALLSLQTQVTITSVVAIVAFLWPFNLERARVATYSITILSLFTLTSGFMIPASEIPAYWKWAMYAYGLVVPKCF